MNPLVIILLGSKSDLEHAKKIESACTQFGLESVVHIGSAHKSAGHVMQLLDKYEAQARPKLYITIAGMSNALSGFTDGYVSAPVIACPPPSDAFGGMDLLSSVRMPSGIAAAVILSPSNAALFAAKFFGQFDSDIHQRVLAFQKAQTEKIIKDDQDLRP